MTYSVMRIASVEAGIAIQQFHNLAAALFGAIMHPGITDATVSFVEDGHTWVLVTKPATALATGQATFTSETLTEAINVYPDRKDDEPEYGLIIVYNDEAKAISDFTAKSTAAMWVTIAKERGPFMAYTSTSLVWQWVRVACIEQKYDCRKVVVITEQGECIRLTRYCAEIGEGDWIANIDLEAAEIIMRHGLRLRRQERTNASHQG